MNWEQIGQEFMEKLPLIGIAIGKFLLVVVVGVILEKILMALLRKVLYKTKMDAAVISFVLSLSKIALKIAIIILALGALNLDVTALTASLGMFGVALSVALKDTLSSVASGLNIIVNKPFKNGDFVEIGSYSGVIQGIKMMSTELLTGDNKVIVIPNSVVNNSAVVNYSTQDIRRIDMSMGVAYGTDVDTVKNAMYEVVATNDLVLKDKGIMVVLERYDASSISFKARFWVKNSNYWSAYWAIQEGFVRSFTKYGIEIPFDQVDVHLNNIVAEDKDYPKPPTIPEPEPVKEEPKEEPVENTLNKIDSFFTEKLKPHKSLKSKAKKTTDKADKKVEEKKTDKKADKK